MNPNLPIKAAYLFCTNSSEDPVAAGVLRECVAQLQLRETGDSFAGHPILRWQSPAGNLAALFAATDAVVSHDYARYLPEMNRCFDDCDFVGIVNWHAGANAPDRILCAHTTGDVPGGWFAPADPVMYSGLLRALRAGGGGYATLSEATHWSGANYRGDLRQMSAFAVPVMDIEIGSSPVSWADPVARAVLARALTSFADHLQPDAPAILCLGGVHFEPAFCQPFLDAPGSGFNLAHILPNHWLAAESYSGGEGADRLVNAAKSVRGGVHAIAFHDNLKGAIKDAVRRAASHLGVPAFNHRTLRDPARLGAALAVPAIP